GIHLAPGCRVPQPHPPLVPACGEQSASALNATPRTGPSCPVKGSPTGRPVTGFHRSTQPSEHVVATRAGCWPEDWSGSAPGTTLDSVILLSVTVGGNSLTPVPQASPKGPRCPRCP